MSELFDFGNRPLIRTYVRRPEYVAAVKIDDYALHGVNVEKIIRWIDKKNGVLIGPMNRHWLRTPYENSLIDDGIPAESYICFFPNKRTNTGDYLVKDSYGNVDVWKSEDFEKTFGIPEGGNLE